MLIDRTVFEMSFTLKKFYQNFYQNFDRTYPKTWTNLICTYIGNTFLKYLKATTNVTEVLTININKNQEKCNILEQIQYDTDLTCSQSNLSR